MSSAITIRANMITAEEAFTPIRRPFSSTDGAFHLFPEEDCVRLHVSERPDDMPLRSYLDAESVTEALGQVATYLDLRREWFGARHIIGITHAKMAELAVNHFGFTRLDVPKNYFGFADVVMMNTYESRPHLVAMDADDFTARYGGNAPTASTLKVAMKHNLADRYEDLIPTDGIENELPGALNIDVSTEANYISAVTGLPETARRA